MVSTISGRAISISENIKGEKLVKLLNYKRRNRKKEKEKGKGKRIVALGHSKKGYKL